MAPRSDRVDYASLPTLTREQARAAAAQLLALSGDAPPVPDPMLRAIERHCLREARLLDREDYDAWYAMLADDLFYWLPLVENRYRRDKRPLLDPEAMALFDETKADIAVRLGRLSSRMVWTEDPPTRHTYVIANIEGFETATVGEYEVHSAFVQYRNRSEHDETTLNGRRRDVVRAVGDGFQLVRRLILLPQSVLLGKNLSAFF